MSARRKASKRLPKTPVRHADDRRACTHETGFTLIDLLITIIIVGVLAAIAIPAYQAYVVRAKVTEGLSLIGREKIAIGDFYGSNGRLPQSFEELGWPAATGSVDGGDTASFEHVFGYQSDVWSDVEYKNLSGGSVMVLRSYRKPLWNNVELGLNFQVKTTDGSLKYRCTVNQHPERLIYMPSTCHNSSIEDWSW